MDEEHRWISRRTLIRGRLAVTGTERRPPGTLIVNGNPMPLYTGENGRFVRPYAFGAGSNSVEVRAPIAPGSLIPVVRRLQFHETQGDGARAALRAILTWDDAQAEVDLHVLTPDGQHAFWAAPVLQGGGGLDVDSVDGAGPEIFSLAAPLSGPYLFYVNYWGRFGDDGYHFDDAQRRRPIITVRLTLVFAENTANERRVSRIVPLRRIGDLTLIDALTW